MKMKNIPFKQMFSLKEKTINNDTVLSDIVNNIVIHSIKPYIEQIQSEGLKNYISNLLHTDIDYFYLSKIQKYLAPLRNIEISPKLGMANVQYRNKKIQINLTGPIALFVSEITINNKQLIIALNDVIEQFQEKYINDLSYLYKKIYEIFKVLSTAQLYKPKTAQEKTLYDIILLLLINYYKGTTKTPNWMQEAIGNLEQEDIIESLFNSIVKQVLSIFINVSENIYIDLKVTFDSRILRVTLNKKTKHGQVSELLNLLNIDINSIIKEFIDDYMSPSFIKGIGEFVTEILTSALFKLSKTNPQLDDSSSFSKNIFNLTMTLGKYPNTQRALRWFSNFPINNLIVEYSENLNFSNAKECSVLEQNVLIPKTVFGLGLFSSYKTKEVVKYSAIMKGLKSGKTYYYRIKSKNNNFVYATRTFKMPNIKENDCEFLIFADSQGMVKSDYNVFLKVFNEAVKKNTNSEFCVHLGDFVDDGNNENYWNWILNNNIWGANPIVPIAGNHEAIANKKSLIFEIENALMRHFFIQALPKQNLSTGMHYSFEYKNILFIILNTNDLDENNKLNETQYDWAIKTAKASNANWKIVFSHKTPYSNGPHHNDDNVKKMSKQLNNLCSQANIDIFIAGHDHVYLRTPILNNNKKIKHETKFTTYNKIKFETAVNPQGTLFITPGTTGVKNYKQDLSLIIPTEFMSQPDCPTYSSIKVSSNKLYFCTYAYDLINNTSTLLDCYAIEKTEKALSKNSQHSFNYNKQNLKNNFLKNQHNKGLLEVTVSNKYQFLQAIKDKKIGTIFTNGNDIKFESLLGKDKFITINRNLCIKGSSRLINVCFRVKNNATLLIDDMVFIDNSRNKNSLYKSINAIELFDSSTLILEKYAALRTEYGTGKNGYCIYLAGENTSAYLNSKSEHFGAKGSIFSKNSNSKIIINDGTYTSNKKQYAIKTNGKLKINGGIIKDIYAYTKAKIEINNGIIGKDKNNNSLVPVKSYSNIYITGAQISEHNGISIQLCGKNSNLYLCPNHKGAINIAGLTPYLGPVKFIPNEYIFIGLDDCNLHLCNRNDKIYSSKISFESLEQKVNSKSKPLYTQIDGHMRAKIPFGKQYVFAKVVYADYKKNNRAILCNKDSIAYLYSNSKFVENDIKIKPGDVK